MYGTFFSFPFRALFKVCQVFKKNSAIYARQKFFVQSILHVSVDEVRTRKDAWAYEGIILFWILSNSKSF